MSNKDSFKYLNLTVHEDKISLMRTLKFINESILDEMEELTQEDKTTLYSDYLLNSPRTNIQMGLNVMGGLDGEN